MLTLRRAARRRRRATRDTPHAAHYHVTMLLSHAEHTTIIILIMHLNKAPINNSNNPLITMLLLTSILSLKKYVWFFLQTIQTYKYHRFPTGMP